MINSKKKKISLKNFSDFLKNQGYSFDERSMKYFFDFYKENDSFTKNRFFKKYNQIIITL